ncbi:MAG: hypothetical protein ACYC6M_09480 [Terriglobales bacterium]
MRSHLLLPLVLVCLLGGAAAQSLSFLADEATVSAINNATTEPDLAKRIALLDALQKSTPAAAAPFLDEVYASAYYGAKDYPKAIEWGEKVLATHPDDAETLATLVNAAAQLKDTTRLLGYAADVQAAAKMAGDTEYAKSNRDLAAKTLPFVEYSSYQGVQAAADPEQQVALAAKFFAALPESQSAAAVGQIAAQALGKLPLAAAQSSGEALLAKSPDNVPLLLTLAGLDSDKGKGADLARGIAHARHAIELLKTQTAPAGAAADWDASRKASMGYAYNTIGYTYMRQEQTGKAIEEFKTARDLVAANPQMNAIVLYRLAYAYAVAKQYRAAKPVVGACIQLHGVTEAQCKELAGKIARAGG